MRTKLLQLGLLAIILSFTGIVNEASSQPEKEEFRRFSITLNGGVVHTRLSPGGRIDAGFDEPTKNLLNFGGSLQYAVTPYLSLEANVHYFEFENKKQTLGSHYETTAIVYSFRTIVHFNQLFRTNRITNYVAPYGFAGIGMMSYDAKTDWHPRGPNKSSTEQSSVIGLGMLFYITRTLDFFIQYEHHFATDDLDLRSRTGNYSDSFIAGVAGLKINFGPRNARHASWRRAPVDIFEDDYNRLMALHGRMDELERRVNQDMEDLSGRVGTLETRVDDHETRIKDLEDKFANLDARVRDIEKKYEKVETDEDMFADGLPNGHYVQVYASHGISNARKVRENTVRIVDGMLDNADSMVFITKRRQFYEVRVGVFNRFPDAANVMRTAQGTYSDAFVVTFPRPPHLRELYRDIRRVE